MRGHDTNDRQRKDRDTRVSDNLPLPRIDEATQAVIKMEPKYGYYPWWPKNGNDWIHPEDVELARTLIPSTRVFRRDGEYGEYFILHYGDLKLRVLPTLWQEVETEGYEIGDWVEVLSRGFRNTPRTAVIREIHWDSASRSLRYQVTENDKPVPKQYAAEDLRPVDPTENLSEE